MTSAVLAPAALALLFVVAAARLAARELRAFVRVAPAPLEERLLVVVPARDEAARIGPTLDALLAEPSPHLAVLVYDDRSSDGTAALVEARAADRRLHLVRGDDEPPPGSCGKPVALQRALDAARARGLASGGPVLFLDADVVLVPGALGGLLRAKRASGAAALSGLPRLVLQTAAEQMFVPAFASVLAGRAPPSKVHDPDSAAAFLNGQVLLVDEAALDDVGGWSAVADRILEDVALAGRLKGRGHALRLADLRAIASTRMYASWSGIVEGFGKNAVPAAGGPARAITAAALGLAAAWAAPASAAAALSAGRLDLVAAAVALWLCADAIRASTRRKVGLPAWPAFASPVVYAGVAFVLARAAARVVLGGTFTWKGRRYGAGRAR